jgi:hypothetical protein
VALPVALGFFTDGLAFRFRSLAVGDAVGLLADSDTLGAVKQFASFVRALDFTLGLLAFHIANCVFGFST